MAPDRRVRAVVDVARIMVGQHLARPVVRHGAGVAPARILPFADAAAVGDFGVDGNCLHPLKGLRMAKLMARTHDRIADYRKIQRIGRDLDSLHRAQDRTQQVIVDDMAFEGCLHQ